MKKSLLGKLLAGVMSLGMVSGRNFTLSVSNNLKNNLAFYNEDSDGEEDQINNNQNKVWAGLSAAGDFMGLPLLSHVFFGEAGEGKLALATTFVVYFGKNAIDDKLSSEDEKKAKDIENDRFLVKYKLKDISKLDDNVKQLITLTEDPSKLKCENGKYYYDANEISEEEYKTAKKHLDLREADHHYVSNTIGYLHPVLWALWDVNKIVKII